jgi:alcohol dehydrogenase class IV
MTEKFQFLMPMQIYFGENIIQKIGEKTRAFGSRALIVAGAMAKNSGALQKVIHPLEKAGIEYVLFDKVEAQPRVPTIVEGAQLAREKKCEVVIGIGGECPMDAAKVMAALAQDTVPISNYFGEDKLRNHPLPIITVPPTAGSGSEVTPFSAITTENDYLEIQTVVSSSIYPTLAFVDPQFLSFSFGCHDRQWSRCLIP